MKIKTIQLIVTLLLCNLLYGQTEEKLNVVSSASIFQDMAKQIGGDRIISSTIVPIGGDPHTYHPTPSDVLLIQDADVIFINELSFEGWVKDLINNSGTKGTTHTITNGITPITSAKYKNSYDPHAWMDAQNGLIYISNIKNALVKADPKNKDYYNENYNNYYRKLKDLDYYIRQQIASIPEKQRVLITSHDAFAYYSKKYGLINNAIMGISTDAEAQVSDILRITKAIKENQVPAVFIESTINPKMIEQVARDNNVEIGGELFADSIGDEDSDAPSYFDMLKHNTDVIVKALSSDSSSSPSSNQSNNNWIMYLSIGLIMALAIIFMVFKFNKN